MPLKPLPQIHSRLPLPPRLAVVDTLSPVKPRSEAVLHSTLHSSTAPLAPTLPTPSVSPYRNRPSSGRVGMHVGGNFVGGHAAVQRVGASAGSLKVAATTNETEKMEGVIEARMCDATIGDSQFTKPTHEEIKEFCLASGGGYGAIDKKAGKFYVGAYDAFLLPRALSPERGAKLSRSLASRVASGTSNAGNGTSHVGTEPVDRGSGRRAHMWRGDTSKSLNQIVKPSEQDGFAQGRPPRGLISKWARAAGKMRSSATPPTLALPLGADCFGALVLNVTHSHGGCLAKQGIISVTVRVEAPAQTPHAASGGVYLLENKMQSLAHHWPSYRSWHGHKDVPGCYPSTTSHLVGSVPLPQVPLPQVPPTSEAFAWVWKDVTSVIKVPHHQGATSLVYKLPALETGHANACLVQVGLSLALCFSCTGWSFACTLLLLHFATVWCCLSCTGFSSVVCCSVLQCAVAMVLAVVHGMLVRLVHAATHCNTLQHTATHCNTLHGILVRLVHAATHCNTLQHTATHCTGCWCG